LARELRFPVDFPRPAAVGRERLFEAERARRDVREDETNVNRAAVERVPSEELAAAVQELAEHGRRVERAGGSIRPGDVPAPSGGVVQPNRQPLNPTGRTADIQLADVGASLPHPAYDGRAVVIDPLTRTSQRVVEPRQVSRPRADLESEIALSIFLRDRVERGQDSDHRDA